MAVITIRPGPDRLFDEWTARRSGVDDRQRAVEGFEPRSQLGGRRHPAAHVELGFFAIERAMADEHQPQFGARFFWLFVERFLQLIVIGRLRLRFQADDAVFCVGGETGFFPRTRPARKRLAILLGSRSADHDQHGRWIPTAGEGERSENQTIMGTAIAKTAKRSRKYAVRIGRKTSRDEKAAERKSSGTISAPRRGRFEPGGEAKPLRPWRAAEQEVIDMEEAAIGAGEAREFPREQPGSPKLYAGLRRSATLIAQGQRQSAATRPAPSAAGRIQGGEAEKRAKGGEVEHGRAHHKASRNWVDAPRLA